MHFRFFFFCQKGSINRSILFIYFYYYLIQYFRLYRVNPEYSLKLSICMDKCSNIIYQYLPQLVILQLYNTGVPGIPGMKGEKGMSQFTKYIIDHKILYISS